MAVSEVRLGGALTEREADNIERYLQRSGYKVSRDIENGTLQAERPDVIEKSGFLNAIVSMGETNYFAGVSYGAFRRCALYARIARDNLEVGRFVDEAYLSMPARFLPVGFGEPERIIAETVRPSAEWAAVNTDLWRMTPRIAAAWAMVAEAYETDGMAMNPAPRSKYPVSLSSL